MNNLLPTALAYLSKGYSVIPVGMNKLPLLRHWKEYQSRYPTVDELVGWWTQFPEAQIAIVTGKISNLTVIDLEADADFNFVKDETYRVKTGGGGVHVYLKFEKEFKNAVRLFPSVDLRTEGGYVISAGSRTFKGPYVALNTLEVSQMSSETKTKLLGANRGQLPWYASSGQTSYPKVSTEGLEYKGFGQGSRNDEMARYAGSIHAKLHPSLWSSIGWQLFEDANRKNTPPLPLNELRATWNSIGNIEKRNNPSGRDYSSPAPARTWGPAPEKQNPVEEIEAEDPTLDPKETLHVSEVASLQKIDTDHTYPIDMLPFDEALLGGFTAGDLVAVAGATGNGKTTITQDWSVTLSSGGQTKREKLPSLWFSYEVLAKPLWQKFQSMGASLDTPIYMPRFNETGETEWVIDVIEKAIVKWGIKVVCIDHLGFLRAPKGNYANAADAITHTVRLLKRLAVKRGLIIFLPVHLRKTLSRVPLLDDIRDSSGIAQEASTVFFISRDKDKSGIATQKTKLWLVKNRKTGVEVSAMFDYVFGRFYYSADETKKEEEKEDLKKTVDDLWDKI